MKYFGLKQLLLFVAVSISLSFSDSWRPQYEPILMMRDDMEAAVQLSEAREIEKPGKIWIQDQMIFVIEKYRGVHLIDNTDPSNPIKKGFINVDGCTDVAVKQNIIFANNAVDLIGIKTTPDFQSISVVSRNRNVLPVLQSPEGWTSGDFSKHRPENSIIVRWETYNAN